MVRKISNFVLAFVLAVAMLLPAGVAQAAEVTQLAAGDHFYFGSYPQTEIVAKAAQSGVTGNPWEVGGEYEVDEALYKKLTQAVFDYDDNVVIDGFKYHRAKKNDAANINSSNYYYTWSDDSTFHYFRFEPIEWRVLSVSGDKVCVMSEIALDAQKYHFAPLNVTWENSWMRYWLNSTFLDRAFSQSQQAVISEETIQNNANNQYGTAGGNETTDKIYLLADTDVYTDNAVNYGFNSSAAELDSARVCKSSTFAKAMGMATEYDNDDYKGNCNWFLRTAGNSQKRVVNVEANGSVAEIGTFVEYCNAVRPVLNIDYKSAFDAGYINNISEFKPVLEYSSIDYDGTEKEPAMKIGNLVSGTDYKVDYSNNIGLGTATATATGIGNGVGTNSKDFTITIGKIAKKTIELEYETVVFDGTAKKPVVTMAGVKEDVDFTVSYSKNVNVGTAKVTVTGIGNYEGTLSKEFKITKADITSMNLALAYEEVAYDGSAKKPKAKVDTLVEGTDYKVEYRDNVKVGTASVTVTGTGNYEGTLSSSFKILSVNMSKFQALINAATFTYSGKSITPEITVKNTSGNIINPSEYTILMANNTEVGLATAAIIGNGNYVGMFAFNFKIVPAGTTFSKITAGSKSFSVTWKKQSQKTTGYQIRYSTSSSMSSAKTVTISKNTTTSATIKSLSSKKKYYVQIRTYKTVDENKYYSSWSSSKSITTK